MIKKTRIVKWISKRQPVRNRLLGGEKKMRERVGEGIVLSSAFQIDACRIELLAENAQLFFAGRLSGTEAGDNL